MLRGNKETLQGRSLKLMYLLVWNSSKYEINKPINLKLINLKL